MLAVLRFLAACIMGAFMIVFGPLVRLSQPKHSVAVATPNRLPPNPLYFPNYMQNKQGMWLYWRQWSPVGAPTGVVFLVEGFAEHAGRYDSVAARFTARGYAVFLLDHQGHGSSEGERVYVERFNDFVDDLEQFVRVRLAADEQLAALPRFIVGHSMGGLITTHLCLRHPDFFCGVALSGPMIEANPETATPFLKKLSAALSDWLPKLAVAKPGLDVSCNPQVSELYLNDPLIGAGLHPIRARFGAESLAAMDALWPEMHRATFPLCVMHGGNDKATELSGSRKLVEHAASSNKALHVYEGFGHELFTDLRADTVYADMFAFIDAHRGVKTADAMNL
jgi:acylglycerol lipase